MPTTVRSTSPMRDTASPAMGIALDWLAANGIDEFIPDRPTFEVDNGPRTITYRANQFVNGARGHDVDNITMSFTRVLIEDRVVPLVVDLDATIIKAFEILGEDETFWANLITIAGGTAMASKDNGPAAVAARHAARS